MMAAMSSLATILTTLTAAKSVPRTSADLKTDLARIDMAALEARIDEIERQRSTLLLTGTDAELAANRETLGAANLQAERAQAARAELQRQIGEAEERENAAALEAQAAEARQAAERLAETYSAIDDHAEKVKALLAEATTAAATVASWNRQAEKAGASGRRLTYIDPAVARARLAKDFQ
jgi:chromosome segregation ATPase